MQVARSVLAAPAADDLRAFREQLLRHDAADARRRAGDDTHSSFETEIHRSLP